jgi:hypothetical protein
MEGVKFSIDRIVVDFTNVYWDFFNPFQQRIRQYFNASFCLREKGFKYHLHVRDSGHYIHISYQLALVPKARKNTLRIECHPDSLAHFYYWLSQLKDNAQAILFVRCDVAYDIPYHCRNCSHYHLRGGTCTHGKGLVTLIKSINDK